MKELIGTIINSIYVSKPRQQYIRFDVGYEWSPIRQFCWFASGDCCSESWFADIQNPQSVIGQVCTGYQEIELPDPEDDRGRQDHDAAYGFRLYSNKGVCDIVFRNSSNGYYGGSIHEPEKELPAHEWGDKEPIEWEPITSDWSAGEYDPHK